MKPDYVHELCTSTESIASAYSKDDSQELASVVKNLRKQWKDIASKTKAAEASDRLGLAAGCGKFPERPSDLFLMVYADVLETLEEDPFANLIGPSLTGASGVIPLSIVSVIPDIMRHYADLIARAEREVFLATNYWENSHSAKLVSDSLRALSKRFEGRPENEQPVVKVVYDRGTPAQAIHNHSMVPPDKWDGVGLPKLEELKGLKMEVVNYHRPPLGTFHAKYMVVDRRVACLNSNNIQDRPNVEMMVHIEGPIVESFYDVAFFTWANAMKPPLPLLKDVPNYEGMQYKFGDDNDRLKYIDTQFSSKAARSMLSKQMDKEREGTASREDTTGVLGHKLRTAAGGEAPHGKNELVGQHPAMQVPDVTASGSDVNKTESNQSTQETQQNAETSPAAVGKDSHPHGSDSGFSDSSTVASVPGANEKSGQPQLEGIDGGHHGDEDHQQQQQQTGGPEVLKTDYDGENGEKKDRISAVTAHLNAATLHEQGTAEDNDQLDDFRPHILHSPHSPVPMVMVNRVPRGTPGHEEVKGVPQNVAWLSAIRNARQSIFIQTPTFNASPVIPAILDACRRGVECTLYLDLGFNDLGEMIPFQGGTNEQVIHSMYTTLNQEQKADNLKIYWYTAKDQKEPISATKKSRNCHVKFMAVDDQIAILGNGNQDTQSWFHSQEVNVLVDSKQLVAEWIAGINANQNTRAYGRVDGKDGIWRAEDGRAIESSGTKKSGLFGSLKGVTGAIKRVRGTGGF